MRVQTFHKHRISRSSTVLAGLLTAHIYYSILFSMPVLYTYLGIRWNDSAITTQGEKAWMLSVLLLWSIMELLRFYLGFNANTRNYMGDAIAFLCISIVPQLVLLCVYYGLVPRRNDLEYSVCLVQLLMLCGEIVFAIRLVMRLSRNTTIDFYVHLGSHNST